MQLNELRAVLAAAMDTAYGGMRGDDEIAMIDAVATWLHDPHRADDIDPTCVDLQSLIDALVITRDRLREPN